MIVLGFDIGGTKSSITLAEVYEEKIDFKDKEEIKTSENWKEIIDNLIEKARPMLKKYNPQKEVYKIGISCGGPLDSERGIIKSPPNLPGWVDVPIVDYIHKALGVKPKLQNDADACALAEWKYGAGRGYKDLIFLTFGTGLGAGLILNGQLYRGANNMAGEVGHIRLADDGPMGYGKKGSFEGFCSGGGIALLGQKKALDLREKGEKASFLKGEIKEITTKDIAQAASDGNKDAIEVFNTSGRYFGRGLSILIDILNPQIIIAGSVFARSGDLLQEQMYLEIEREALSYSSKDVKIVPALLGDKIGDYGAIVTAII